MWLGLAGAFIAQRPDAARVVPLDLAALTVGPTSERWNGVFFQDQHVGFTVNRATPTRDGGTLYEQRSTFRVASFGTIQDVVTMGTALTGAAGQLQRFDFFMRADGVKLAVRGEIAPDGREIVMEVDQAGETTELRFPVARPPHVGMSLEAAISRTELVPGKSFAVPYFDPVTLSEGELQITVESTEVLENGEEAYWLRSRFGSIQTRALVLPSGEMLRQEGALGMSMVRMSAAAAQAIPAGGEPPDLIALSAVSLVGQLPDPRSRRLVTLRITGVPPERIRHEPPLQTRTDDIVTVDVPLLFELPDLPLASTDPVSDAPWLAATLTLPAAHPDIRTKAAALVADAPNRLEAVKTLNAFVYDYVDKVPTLGMPNGLEVLRTARGDCNEHTSLFVSLARAAGIPSRIAAGVVYSDRIGSKGAFYYHAWPEVRLGGPTDWVPVDPTFGQVPADATHVKLVEGDLDRQVEIMAVMGKLGFELIEHR